MYKIIQTASRLTIKDRPVLFWGFYSFFIAGGLVAVYFSFFKSPDALTRMLAFVIGAGNIAGGVTMLRREPASVVEVDRGEIRIRRWGLLGSSSTRTYPLTSFLHAGVEQSEHTEGGRVYRPCISLQAEQVPLSFFWQQSEERSREVADLVDQFIKG